MEGVIVLTDAGPKFRTEYGAIFEFDEACHVVASSHPGAKVAVELVKVEGKDPIALLECFLSTKLMPEQRLDRYLSRLRNEFTEEQRVIVKELALEVFELGMNGKKFFDELPKLMEKHKI